MKTFKEYNKAKKNIPTINEIIGDPSRDTVSNYNKYAKALKLYKTNKYKDEYDRELSSLFRGSKLTSRFIFRSLKSPSNSMYKKDISDFGQSKIDTLVNKVLKILS